MRRQLDRFECRSQLGIVKSTSRLRVTPSCRIRYPNLGQLGKKNLKNILGKFVQLTWLAVCASCVASCAGHLSDPLQSGQVLPLLGLEGRWVGEVVPAAASCGTSTQALMSIGERGFGFDPFESTAVIHGTVEGDRLAGKLVRQGREHQDLSLAFEGTAVGDIISGTLRSGRCLWTVHMHRG
jgi:hypothetical protein